MTLEELLKLIAAEHREAVEAFFNELNDKIINLTKEISDLESSDKTAELQGKMDDAIAKRDSIKAQLNIVRDTLGLPTGKEVTNELVQAHLDDASKGDAELRRQNDALKADVKDLESTVEEKDRLLEERETVIESTKKEAEFMKVFSKCMPSFKAASPIANDEIKQLLREGAIAEGEKIVYKDGDSYIRVEGVKMDMKMRLSQLQDDPDQSFRFETKASGGSGSGNGAGGGGASRFEQRKRAANIR